MRLVDADALMRKFKTASPMAIDGRARQIVDDMPTVEPKKGKWETEIRSNRDGTRSAYYACSVCGVYALDEHNFCPNCGARMEGLDETD